MAINNRLIFEKNKDAGQNTAIFLKYLKTKKKPWSTILKKTLELNLNEDDFRKKIKEEVHAHLEKVK